MIIFLYELLKFCHLILIVHQCPLILILLIYFVQETLIKINEQNKSIILISTDTDELLKLSDKISVIHKGKLSKIMNADEVTSEKLGILMGGGNWLKL